jgi:putative hemolysin
VSVEDLAEEVLGEIVGETETPAPALEAEGPGTWVAPGATPVHEINRELGTDLPLDPSWTTLAGLILHHTGSLPATGTRVSLEGGVEAEILDATNRRIGRVRIRIAGHREGVG